MTEANSRNYTPEFREESVKTILAQGLSLEEASRRLGVPKGTLANWVAAARRSVTATAIPGSRTMAELEAEVVKLRKDLAEACMERDVIKKLRRTSLGSRCPVRANEINATRLSRDFTLPCLCCLSQQLLCLVES